MASGLVDNKFIQVDQWGFPLQPGVLSLQTEKLDLSKTQDDDIVVKMKYACLHPADILLALKFYPVSYNISHDILPSRMGLEGVGEVIKVGSKVKDFKVGDRIYPDNQDQPKQWQSYLVVKGGIPIPPYLKDEIAAQSVVNPYTALGLLDDFQLIDGKQEGWIVMDAANSTVGRLLLSIAKQKGLKVIGIVRKQDAVQLVKDLGATKVIVSESFKTADDYTKAILETAGGEPVKYGIDCIGAEPALGIFNSISQNGQLDCFGILSGKPFSAEGLPNPKNVKSKFYDSYDYVAKPREHIGPQIDYFFKLFQDGKLDLPIEKIFNLDEYIQAFAFQVQSEKSRTGKILLKF